jgi:hypothetical protein
MRVRLAAGLAPGVVALLRAQAPDPQTLGPKVGEHVPVYQRPFRIVQDLAIDSSPPAVAALKDRTEMDDQVCFTPPSVPITWTIGLRALDRDRANPGK